LFSFLNIKNSNICLYANRKLLLLPLQTTQLFVWLDAIHYKIKDEGRYVKKAVYTYWD